MLTPVTEEYVFDRFQETPYTSTRAVAAKNSVSSVYFPAWRVLREERIQHFLLQRVQCLKDDDYSHRLPFVRWMLQSIMNNPQFLN